MFSQKKIHIPKLLIILTFLLSLLFLMMGYHCYPVQKGDSTWLLPFAVSFSNGEGMISPFQYWYSTDGSGVIYFFFYWLLGSICPFSSYPTIIMLLTILKISCLWVLLSILWAEAQNHNSSSKLKIIAVASAILCSCSFLLGGGARPEIFIFFLVLVGMHAFQKVNSKAHWAIGGALLAIMFVSHPLESGFLGLSLAIYFSLVFDAKTAIFNILLSYLLCLILAFGLISLYPQGGTEWFKLLSEAANMTIARTTGRTFLQTWFLNSMSSFYGPFFLLGTFYFPLLIKMQT
jgi:hypothetical protein